MRESNNVRVLDMDRSNNDAVVVAVRVVLAPDAFAGAWALGRATRLHEVVANVLA